MRRASGYLALGTGRSCCQRCLTRHASAPCPVCFAVLTLPQFESDEFDVFEEEGAVTLRLAHLGAELVVTPTQTTIRTRDLKLRRRLAHLVARHFYSS